MTENNAKPSDVDNQEKGAVDLSSLANLNFGPAWSDPKANQRQSRRDSSDQGSPAPITSLLEPVAQVRDLFRNYLENIQVFMYSTELWSAVPSKAAARNASPRDRATPVSQPVRRGLTPVSQTGT